MSIDLSTCRIPSTDSELDALLKEHLADKVPAAWGWLGECAVRELARRAGAVPPVEVAPRLALAVLAEYHLGSGVQHPEPIRVLEKAYADACGRHIKAGLRLSKARAKAGTAYCPTPETAERLAKAVESAKSAAELAARERDSAMDALNAAAAEWEKAFQDRASLHPAGIRHCDRCGRGLQADGRGFFEPTGENLCPDCLRKAEEEHENRLDADLGIVRDEDGFALDL